MKKNQYLEDVLGDGDKDSENEDKKQKIRQLRSHPSVIQAVQTYQNLFKSIDSLFSPGDVFEKRDIVSELELPVLDSMQIGAFAEMIREKEPKEITENHLTGDFITRLIRESYEAGNNGFSLNLNGGEMKSFGKNLKGTSSNSLIINIKGSLGYGSANGQENCIMNISDCVWGEFAENSKNSIYVIEKEMQGKSLGKGSTNCSFRVKGDANIECETSDESAYDFASRKKMKERFDFDWYWREQFYPTIRRTKAKEKLGNNLGERVGKVNDWVLKKAELENIVDDREIDYWKEKLGENGWMMSVADFYNIMKNRKNFVKEALTSEDILTSFRKKMKESIGTSTEILRLENGNIQIVHRYGFSSEKRIEMPFPEFKPDKIEEVMKTNDGRKYVSALLGTSDSAKTIKETLEPLAKTIGINLPRDDTERQHFFLTLETEDEDPELTELLEREDELPEFPVLEVSSLWSSRMRDGVSYGITTDTKGFVEEPEWLKENDDSKRKSISERKRERAKSLDDVVRKEKIVLPKDYYKKIISVGWKAGLCLGLVGGAIVGGSYGSEVEDTDHFLYQTGVFLAAILGLAGGAFGGFLVAANSNNRENIPQALVIGGGIGALILGGGAYQSGNAAVGGGIVIGALGGTLIGLIGGSILGYVSSKATKFVNYLRGYRTG